MSKSLQQLASELEEANVRIKWWNDKPDSDQKTARLKKLRAKQHNLKRAIARRQKGPSEKKPPGRPRKQGRGVEISFTYEEAVALGWEGLTPQQIKALLLSQAQSD